MSWMSEELPPDVKVGLHSLSFGDLLRAGTGAGAVWGGSCDEALSRGDAPSEALSRPCTCSPIPQWPGFPLRSQVRVIRYSWPVLLPASLTQVPVPLTLVFVLDPLEELDPKGLGCVASPWVPWQWALHILLAVPAWEACPVAGELAS